jgi:hypothetical protein
MILLQLLYCKAFDMRAAQVHKMALFGRYMLDELSAQPGCMQVKAAALRQTRISAGRQQQKTVSAG